jgi:hypothetical protein
MHTCVEAYIDHDIKHDQLNISNSNDASCRQKNNLAKLGYFSHSKISDFKMGTD